MNDVNLSYNDEDFYQQKTGLDALSSERLKHFEDELDYIQPDPNEIKKSMRSMNQSRYSKTTSAQMQPSPNENQANVYDYLLQFKEKNNKLQLKLDDLSKFKNEIESKNKKISEMEKSLCQHKTEIKRLHLRNEENIKQNLNWENSFREFKGKIIKLEEEKIKLNDEIDKWRVKYEDLEFKQEILKEKFKFNEENVQNLKRIQSEYETSQIDLIKDFKNKEENLKKKFEEITKNVENRLKETESENLNEKQKFQDTIKSMEKIISKQNDQIVDLKEEIEDMTLENRKNEKELIHTLEEKDNRIIELENDFKSLSSEANAHIMKLNENISEINEKIKQKETFFFAEIEKLNENFEEEKENNLQLEKLVDELKTKLKRTSLDKDANISIIDTEKGNKSHLRNEKIEKLPIDPGYVKKIENELNILKKILSEKQDEVDRLKNEMNRTLNSMNNSEYIKGSIKMGRNSELLYPQSIESLRDQMNSVQDEMKKKENENEDIKRKFNQLRKYCKELEELKEHYEKTLIEMKYDLNKKNEEVYLLKMNYDRIIQEFQEKLDRVLI